MRAPETNESGGKSNLLGLRWEINEDNFGPPLAFESEGRVFRIIYTTIWYNSGNVAGNGAVMLSLRRLMLSSSRDPARPLRDGVGCGRIVN